MEIDSAAIKQKTYSLHEVMLSIQSVLLKTYANRQYWVRCELSRISFHAQSGHCYLELIDKNEKAIVAQQRGIIWSEKYNIISEKFLSVTNTSLAGGMKVLLQCSVNFHPVHGLSLTVTDIEPSFTLGEMARMKNESIDRLKSEGLFNQNRQLKLPILPGRIALVSVDTSRGYQDFISTIENHQRHYAISYQLFEAILQGENAVPTLINAINKILSVKNKFDAIAIIRGGAGDAGLACYDEYALAALIARSPLPVITGIGHATNETVVEMIAYKNCITPTAAATFILEKFDTQSSLLNEEAGILTELIKNYLTGEKKYLSSQTEIFFLNVRNHMNRQNFQLQNLLTVIPANINRVFSFLNQDLKQKIQTILSVRRFNNMEMLFAELNKKITEISHYIENHFQNSKNKLSEQNIKTGLSLSLLNRNKESLQHLTEKISLLDPVNTLKRGYSITRSKGKVLTEASDVSAGMQVETELANGFLISTVDRK